MNVLLAPTEIELDYFFIQTEFFKSDEDIKLCSFNDHGTLLFIVLKTSNLIKIYDFIGKHVVCTITHFQETEKTVNHVCWSNDSSKISVTFCHERTKQYGISLIEISNKLVHSNYHLVLFDELYDYLIFKTKFEPNILYLAGGNPTIKNLIEKKNFQFFKKAIKNRTFIVQEAIDNCHYLIFLREIFAIFIVRLCEVPIKNFDFKKLNLTKELIELIENFLEFIQIIEVFALPSNVEITNVQVNQAKTLFLVNSSDKVLRLFKYNNDTTKSITLVKEFSDSVNRKKWVNSYFYSKVSKDDYQDLIICALSDSTSIELSFIDVDKGNYVKRLEPYKYQCSDFTCHYRNHYSIVLVSNKKLFLAFGYLINHWSAYAPQFKFLDENKESSEIDPFQDSDKPINFDKNMIRNLFLPNKLISNEADDIEMNENKNKNILIMNNENLFLKFFPFENDPFVKKSENELREIMDNFNEIIEIKRKKFN